MQYMHFRRFDFFLLLLFPRWLDVVHNDNTIHSQCCTHSSPLTRNQRSPTEKSNTASGWVLFLVVDLVCLADIHKSPSSTRSTYLDKVFTIFKRMDNGSNEHEVNIRLYSRQRMDNKRISLAISNFCCCCGFHHYQHHLYWHEYSSAILYFVRVFFGAGAKRNYLCTISICQSSAHPYICYQQNGHLNTISIVSHMQLH